MSISMHSASAPIFLRQLTAMLGWLDKADIHAQARGFDAVAFLQQRLAPDMLPLVSQVRIASDAAKGCMARLSRQESPKFEDNESTVAEVRQRIQKTIDYVASVPASAVDGSEGLEVVIPLRNRDPLKFDGETYLKHFALPNFQFHCSMTYALLRPAGVALGKADYLGG